MTSNHHVPVIRFKGFTDAWEQRNIKELSKVFIGLVTSMTENYREEGTLLIRNSDIKPGKFEFATNPIHLDEEFAKKNETRRLKIGDVVTVHTGDIGTSAVIGEREHGAIGFATINTRPDSDILNSDFLSTFFNTTKHKNWAIKMSTGDGRSNYNLYDFNRLMIPLPSIKEQTKIGNFFKQLDDTIALHQRELDLLKEQKKGFLQKMFPKKDELVPEIRFAGFTDAWEQRKLGNYIIQYTEVTTRNNQYPVLTSSRQGIFFQKDYYDGNQIASKDNTGYNIVPRGYFTYRHMSDDLIFKFNINNITDNGIVSTLYPVFTTKKSLDSTYLQYQLNYGEEFKRFALLQKQGGSRTYMYLSKLKNMLLTIPSYDEQITISSFLKQLDDTIALHQCELEKLLEMKKAFLQKMFV